MNKETKHDPGGLVEHLVKFEGVSRAKLRITIPYVLGGSWGTLVNNIRINDAPTSYCSPEVNVESHSAAWICIDIDSTLAPTLLRVLPQFQDNAGNWYDFEEGLWASLCWEDQDTAAGLQKTYLLPLGGFDRFRICIIGTGTDANNYFDVTIKARAFRGAFGVAHA